MFTFGFYIKDWRTIPLYRAPSVGAFPSDNTHWDPERWKPRYASSAFRSARMDDKFWAARRVQYFTDEMLGAVPSVGQFDDPASEQALATFFMERRDAIVRRYLPAVNPIVDVELDPSGLLTFGNAAVDAGVSPAPTGYAVQWLRFDNATGETSAIGASRAPDGRVQAPPELPSAAGSYIRAEIAAEGGPPSWAEPVHAYFVREADGWRLVGFERLPGGNPPGSGSDSAPEPTES